MEPYSIVNMSGKPAIYKKSSSKWLNSSKPLTQHLKGMIFAFPQVEQRQHLDEEGKQITIH